MHCVCSHVSRASTVLRRNGLPRTNVLFFTFVVCSSFRQAFALESGALKKTSLAVANQADVSKFNSSLIVRQQGGHKLDAQLVHKMRGMRSHAAVTSSASTMLLDRFARKPMEVAELGGSVLAAKASIVGRAVSTAMRGSAEAVERGDIAGALTGALRAVSQARKEADEIDSRTSAKAAESLGIMTFIVFIAFSWIVELATTARKPGTSRHFVETDSEPREKEIRSPIRDQKMLYAISFVRYLMSWHVVLNNFYRRGDGHQTSAVGQPWAVFARWGVLAAPWFFIASGFTNTYSKLTGPRPDQEEDFMYGMVRRVATWYPLFLLTLTWCALRMWSTQAEDWSHYMANMLLIHGVIWENGYFPFMIGDWWFCFLMVYLLTFSPMYGVLSSCANSVLWTMFTLAFVVAVPSAMLEWHMFGKFPPFLLLQYWPSFIFGQALAVWFVRTCMQQRAAVVAKGSARVGHVWVIRPVHEIPALVRFGVTVSFAAFGIMFFTFSPYDHLPLIHKEVAPLLIKGGLAPLQGLMIVGLACEVDPMAKLFARKPFRWAEKVTLTNFVFQVPVHNAVRDLFGWDGFTWTFSFALFSFSVLGYLAIELPWRRFLGVRAK